MNRRQKMENIIIGTLLESQSGDNYFTECGMLTPDMFLDDTNRQIFCYVSEMNAKGLCDTTPYDIFMEYEARVAGLVARMCELVTNFSFTKLKAQYNEKCFLADAIFQVAIQPTEVKFVDYVNRFIKMVFNYEENRE